MALASVAQATTYYVRTSGNDAADGLTPATAFRTVRKAAAALANPGDGVIVGPGTYAEGNISFIRDGIPGRWVTFRADPSGKITGDAAGPVVLAPVAPAETGFILLGRHHVLIDGFEIRGASDAAIQVRTSIAGLDSHDITIRNVKAFNGAKRGFDITASGALTLTNCQAERNGSSGVVINGAAGANVEVSIENLLANDNGSYGLFLTGGAGGAITSSRFLRNAMSGLSLRHAYDITVADVQASNNSEYGIIAGVANDPFQGVTNLAVLESIFDLNNKAGINIAIAAGGEIRLVGNRVRNNQSVGIAFTTAPDTAAQPMISLNQVSGNLETGISIQKARAGVVSSNQVLQNSGVGIQIRESSGLSVDANTVTGNTEGGIIIGVIEVTPSGDLTVSSTDTDVRVSHNAVRSNLGTNLRVAARGTVLIEDNTVEASAGSGLSVTSDAAGQIILDNNRISHSAADGLFVSHGLRSIITRNAVQHSNSNGVRVRSDGTALVSDNLVTDSGQAGVDIIAAGDIEAQRNVLEDNGSTGLSLSVSPDSHSNLNILENTIRRNRGAGIFASGSVQVRAHDNLVEDSGTSGGPPAHGLMTRSTMVADLQRNVIHRVTGIGIAVGTATDAEARSAIVSGNDLIDSGKAGISIFTSGPVTTVGNRILRNGSTGLSIQTTGSEATCTVTRNTIGSSKADGLFLLGASSGSVRNNIVFSSTASGMTLRSAANLDVINNLVYANGGEGIGIGTGGYASPQITVLNNTVYANGMRGIRIDPSSVGPATGATVLNNIVAGNALGFAVSRTNSFRYMSGFNINTDGYADGTRRNVFDIQADPLLLNPAGPDGILGGDGYADDDFHLQQRRAGQSVNSPGIDAGSDTVTAMGLGGSTASNGAQDVGVIDIGYHYTTDADAPLQVRRPYMPLYVRANGDDSNDGRRPERALRSLRATRELAVAGATIVAGPGVYAEGDISIKNYSGFVSFVGDPSGRLTGDVPGPVLVDATGYDTGFVFLNGGPVTIRGFHVTGAKTAGIQVRAGADDALVEDNVVFSNERRGIEVFGGHRGMVRNNLVYANGTGGIRITESENSSVINNTVYGNGETGVLIGATYALGGAPGTTVSRNIIAGNGTGLMVTPNSLDGAGYFGSFNIVSGTNPFAASTPRSESDFLADPLFVNPAGADGRLGGAGFADDDFHLKQSNGIVSPAVDLELEAFDKLAGGSTRSDGLPDLGAADAGYHYPFLPAGHTRWSAGEIVFVRPDGADQSDGSSPENAVRTIARAQTLGGRGAFIVMAPGRYEVRGLSVGAAMDATELPVLLGDTKGILTGTDPGAVIFDAGAQRGLSVTGPVLIDGVQMTNAKSRALRITPRARGVTVRNSVFCDNDGQAISSQGDDIDLFNNLVVGNRARGFDISVRRSSAYLRIFNNTIAANESGISILDTTRQPSRTRTFNNLISGNESIGYRLRARRNSIVSGHHNLNTDGYGLGTAAGPGDLRVDPRFTVAPARGRPGCATLDGLRLAPDSPALDAGTGQAYVLSLGDRSVRADGIRDRGIADLGFHFPVIP